jgi:hypothetical protein
MPVRSLWLQRGLWLILGSFAVLVLVILVNESRNNNSSNWFGLTVGTVLLLLCAAGLILRWGPTLPSMFLGMVLALLTMPPNSSAEAAGHQIIGAVVGAIFGYLLDVSGVLSVVPRLPRRYSLRTLLITICVISLCLGLVAAVRDWEPRWKVERARQEAEIERLEKLDEAAFQELLKEIAAAKAAR